MTYDPHAGFSPSTGGVVAVKGVKAMDIDLQGLEVDKEREIRLVAEPSNPYDHNAIQVVMVQPETLPETLTLIGYIPRQIAARIRAEDWEARVAGVLYHDDKPAGVRLMLRRRSQAGAA